MDITKESKFNNTFKLVLVLLIITTMLISFYNKKGSNSKNYNIVIEPNYVNKKYETVYDGKKGDVTYIYNKKIDGVYKKIVDEKNLKSEKLGKYICKNDGCNVFGLDVTEDYLVVYDNYKYFLYDYKKNKNIYEFDIDDNKYWYIEPVYNNNKLKGVILKSGIKSSYYDLKLKKYIVDYSTYNLYYPKELINTNYVLSHSNYENDAKLILDINSGKIKLSGVLNVIGNTKNSYFITNNYVYDQNLRKVSSIDKYEGYTAHIVNDKFLAINKENRIHIYDFENKKVYVGKKYNKIYYIDDKYMIVNDKNYLKLVSHKGKNYVTWTKLNNNMEIYAETVSKDKNGINISVLDNKVKCEDLPKNTKVNGKYLDCSNTNLYFGYKYYYSYKKHKSGKNKTYIYSSIVVKPV